VESDRDGAVMHMPEAGVYFGEGQVLRPLVEFPQSIEVLRARPPDLAEVAQPKESWQSPELARV